MKTTVVRIIVEVANSVFGRVLEMAGLTHFGWMVIYPYSCRNNVIPANYTVLDPFLQETVILINMDSVILTYMDSVNFMILTNKSSLVRLHFVHI